MRRLTVFALFGAGLLFPQAKPVASYAIRARYDAASKAIEGHETLTWLNDSPDAIPELRFHLYMNAFKNEASTFIRESGGSLRSDRTKEGGWGWIRVNRMRISGGADLTRAIQFIHPDDDNAKDQTVIRVPLPEPVAPGRAIQLEIDFHTQLPKVFARTGNHGNFVLAGQWFPKIGVWERAGVRYATGGQWNCHQFHGNSEFYANYGTYDVDLNLPAEYVVGATGVLTRKTPGSGTMTYSYHQENVHDFAWTAQPTYIKIERVFHADQEVTARELAETARRFHITLEEARLSDVRMILLIQPEHAAQTERHFRALAAGIKYFGLWYGRYPHQTITLVDPPHGGGGASGMEYPTFITGGTSWLVSRDSWNPEEVIVHEFGHQFWQGLVGNNEFEEAWMDEGFNTYSTGKVMDKVYGPGVPPVPIAYLPLSWFMSLPKYDSDTFNRAGYLIGGPKADNLARNAWEYDTFLSYAINSYMRTGVMMRTLENYLGEETMARVMRAYQQRWRYGHPAAPDFIRTVKEVSGRDMQWFFNQFIFGSNILDYRVSSASSEPVKIPKGIFDDGGPKGKAPDLFESKITIRREGEAVVPVDIKIVFANGDVVRKRWDGEYRWVKYEFTRPHKLRSVEVDPEHKILLDANFSNNSYVMKPDARAPLKYSSTILFWIEQLLGLLGAAG